MFKIYGLISLWLLSSSVCISDQNDLHKFTSNIADSFGRMALASPKPKAVVFRHVEVHLQKKLKNPKLSGGFFWLCEDKILLKAVLPVIIGMSSEVFSKTTVQSQELVHLLEKATENSCEALGVYESERTLETQLRFIQIGWQSLMGIGFLESDLMQIAELQLRLGGGLADLKDERFKESLRKYLVEMETAQNILEQASENTAALGTVLMIQSLNKALEHFLDSGKKVNISQAFTPGEGVQLRLSDQLMEASVFSIGTIDLGPHFHFIKINPGEYEIGSGRYRQVCALKTPVEIQATELTQFSWNAVMANNPRKKQGNNFPVTEVSIDDIRNFLDVLNNRLSKLQNYYYTLPLAEYWEIAARAGRSYDYPLHSSRTIGKEFSHYDATEPIPVASLRSNQWGFFDMFGNVSEWTATVSLISLLKDPEFRQYEVRGTSYEDKAEEMIAHKVNYETRGDKKGSLGFRLLRMDRKHADIPYSEHLACKSIGEKE